MHSRRRAPQRPEPFPTGCALFSVIPTNPANHFGHGPHRSPLYAPDQWKRPEPCGCPRASSARMLSARLLREMGSPQTDLHLLLSFSVFPFSSVRRRLAAPDPSQNPAIPFRSDRLACSLPVFAPVSPIPFRSGTILPRFFLPVPSFFPPNQIQNDSGGFAEA